MSSARDTEPPATGVALHYFFGVLGFVGAAVLTLVLTFLVLASRRRVSHHRPNYRLAPPAIAFNPPECRCPSRPPSELSLPRRGHPPEPTAAACRVGSLRGPIALSYRVVRSCRGGAVYEKYDGRATCCVGCVVHNYVTE